MEKTGLIGRTIKAVRPMTARELASQGWEDDPHGGIVLILDDGTRLYPSRDEEGNGPGALFGSKGTTFFQIG